MDTLNEQLSTLNRERMELSEKLEELETKLTNFELDPNDYEDQYDVWLDEIYQEACDQLPINVSGSDLIRSHDPVMYRCGFSDYLDSLEVSDDEQYKEIEEEIESLQDQISDLDDQIEELENEIAELEDQQ